MNDKTYSSRDDIGKVIAWVLGGYFSEDAADVLLELCSSELPEVRAQALLTLAINQNPYAVQMVEGGLADPDPQVRIAACKAARIFAIHKSKVVSLLECGDDRVVKVALRTLRYLKYQIAAPKVAVLLDTTSGETLAEVIQTLAELQYTEVSSKILALLSETQEKCVRSAAARALVTLGVTDGYERVEELWRAHSLRPRVAIEVLLGLSPHRALPLVDQAIAQLSGKSLDSFFKTLGTWNESWAEKILLESIDLNSSVPLLILSERNNPVAYSRIESELKRGSSLGVEAALLSGNSRFFEEVLRVLSENSYLMKVYLEKLNALEAYPPTIETLLDRMSTCDSGLKQSVQRLLFTRFERRCVVNAIMKRLTVPSENIKQILLTLEW